MGSDSMFHISDIKRYERCEKLFWLSKKEPQEYVPFVNYNGNMKDLCIEYFMLKDPFIGEVGDDASIAIDALKEKEALINARFEYGDFRIKIPLMIKTEHKWNIYFTYMNCFPKENEAQKIADHLNILDALQIEIEGLYIVHLNSEYERGKEINVRELLSVSENLFNTKNKKGKDVWSLVRDHMRDLESIGIQMKEVMDKEEIKSVRTKACTRGLKCSYYNKCFPEPAKDSSVLHLVQSSNKLKMLEQGIEDMKDVPVDMLEGYAHQYAQIMAAKNGSIFIDKNAVSTWIEDQIHYPISYLDFEWETYAVPPYEKMKPFDVLVFQYSLHIEEEHKPLTHYEFIGENDCRIAFIEQLLKDIPETGTILVYNMEGAEKLRLMQLARQFPQYEKQLVALCDRMVDLSLPFSTGNVYDLRMKGYYSLKTLVPIFSNYSYQDMEVGNGMEAVQTWRSLPSLNEEEKQKTLQNLYEYCSMDTYAEYIVLNALKKLVE